MANSQGLGRLEFTTARNSELLFTVGGLHLCSAYNPTREATQWTQSQASVLKGVKGVIVLGVGCGYHLRSLKNLHLNVVGVEFHRTIAQSALKVHPLDLQDREVVWANSLESLRKNSALSQIVRDPYVVVVHAPSFHLQAEFYESCRQFLLGRSAEGLTWIFEQRRWPWAPSVAVSPELNLKSLDAVWFDDISTDLETWSVFQALRELIV